MTVTWRTELHFTCEDGLDGELPFNPDCHGELILDQLDAKTQRGIEGGE